MLQAKAAFTGFSVDDQEKAKEFYTKVLGLKLNDESMGLEFFFTRWREVIYLS